jgi:alginate O-acetyltransferase complex protein AlgI
MDIISLKFALLAFASVVIFYLISLKYRIPYLVIISCTFIASISYYLLFYILIYALFNYYLGIILPKSKHKIALFRIGILINISQLVLLKYAPIAIDPILHFVYSAAIFSKISAIIVPIGISYFTLQGIGYLINIKMGWEKPEFKFLNFLLFLIYYPKFLSGPIERSNHFLPQLKVNLVFNEHQVTEGLRTILFGVFKKIAIANQLAPFIIETHANVNSSDGYSLWFILLLQPLYLYFDFSGYTDIAIGLSKAFGINLLPNFNRPFFSENMTNFWKRFHISLSSWFNDYVFRQTSFKYRKWGIWASVYAVFITWILFGVWHGSGWNFMILGFVQALAIVFEFFTKNSRLKIFSIAPDRFRVWFGRVSTYLFYAASLTFFFSPNLNSAVKYFSRLNEFTRPLAIDDLSIKPFELLVYIPVILILELIQNDYNNYYEKINSLWMKDRSKSMILRWTLYSLMITIIFVAGFKAKQFVYANF